MSNDDRLAKLRELIADEDPIDGIHNPDVEVLYTDGGECPRYLACTSEGTGESSYRDNPDYFAGNADEVGEFAAGSFEEGWALNWIVDLDGEQAVGWDVSVTLSLSDLIRS